MVSTIIPFAFDLSLDAAIVPNPLLVAPDTSLLEALTLMGQARSSCAIADSRAIEADPQSVETDELMQAARSSCILVVQHGTLCGILTERDLVRLTAREEGFGAIAVGDVMTRDAIADCFRQHRICHLPVLAATGAIEGLITQESLCACLKSTDLLRLRQIEEVMIGEVIQASVGDSVRTIAERMVDYQVSCVVITGADAKNRMLPLEIVTERDILQFRALNLDFHRLQAGTIMSKTCLEHSSRRNLVEHPPTDEAATRASSVGGVQHGGRIAGNSYPKQLAANAESGGSLQRYPSVEARS